MDGVVVRFVLILCLVEIIRVRNPATKAFAVLVRSWWTLVATVGRLKGQSPVAIVEMKGLAEKPSAKRIATRNSTAG